MPSVTEGLKEILSDDWQNLEKQLAAKGIQLGNMIGEGSIAQIYAVKNSAGEVLPSIALRIEPEGSAGTLNSLAIIPVLDKTRSENFEATLVPMAGHDEKLGVEEIRPTLAAINAEGKLRHLNDLSNPIPQQFMRIPGMSIPVFVDLNAVADTPDSAKRSMGGIELFAEQHGVDLQEILSEKTGAAEMEKIRRERAGVIDKAKEELKRFGITAREPSAARSAAC